MTIENVLALGFLPALFTTGRWIQGKLIDDSGHPRESLAFWSLSALIGLVAWLPILVACAWLGIFNAAYLGGLGWVASGILFFIAKKSPSGKLDSADWLAITFSFVVFAWNAYYANESLQGGRDQGVYSNQAMVIARTGSLFSEELFENQLDTEYHHLVRGNQSGGIYFEYDNKRIVFQFAPGFATLLAQGYGMGGYTGLFSVNPALSCLAGLFLFSFIRLIAARRWALFGLVIFSLNIVQFWNARITLSEILAQALLLGGIFVASRSWQTASRGGFALGCILIALNSAVRIDGFLAEIGVACGIILARLSCSHNELVSKKLLLRDGALASLITSLAALAFLSQSSPSYFTHHTHLIYPLVSVSLASCAIAISPIPTTVASWTRRAFRHKALFWVLASTIAIGLSYAYFIRPHLEPFALMHAGHPAAGTRDFRENSLVDLGAYLSPLNLLLAGIGILYLLRDSLRGAASFNLFIGASSVFSLLYLYDPSVSPDHIWKMRRFTPMVIPAIIILSAVGADLVFSKIQRFNTVSKCVGLITAAILISHFYKSTSALAFTKLNDGFASFTDQIANAIPEGAVIITDVDIPLLAPIQFARHYEVIRGHPNYPPHQEYIPELAQTLRDNGKNVHLLTSGAQFSSDLLKQENSFHLKTTDIQPSETPFPLVLRQMSFSAHLVKLGDSYLGYTENTPVLTIGASKILGISESGMYGQEFNGNRPFRWTGKSAEFKIPWIFEKAPLSITLSIGGIKPGGSQISLKANETTIFSEFIPEGGSVVDIPIPEIDWKKPELKLCLEATPWSPSKNIEGSTDTRELGAMLYGLEFRLLKPGLLAAIDFGNKPTEWIRESGLHDTEFIDETQQRWTNGNAQFEFELKPSFTPTSLTIDLSRLPDPDSEVTIYWNDKKLHQAKTPTQTGKIELALPSDLTAKTKAVKLEIVSDTFVPAEIEKSSSDYRKLGVMIRSIQLN